MSAPEFNQAPRDLQNYAIRLDEKGHVQFERNVDRLEGFKNWFGRFLCNFGFLTGSSYKTSKIWEAVKNKTDGLSEVDRGRLTAYLKTVIREEQTGHSFGNWYTRNWHDRKVDEIKIKEIPKGPKHLQAAETRNIADVKGVPKELDVVRGIIGPYLKGLGLVAPDDIEVSVGTNFSITLSFPIYSSSDRKNVLQVEKYLINLRVPDIQIVERKNSDLNLPSMDIVIGEKGVKALYSLLRTE